MPANPFLQVVENEFHRFGKRLRGVMHNRYNLLQSSRTLAQHRAKAVSIAQAGFIGDRSWGMNAHGLDSANQLGDFVYLNPAGPNLVSNPGFESNSNGWNLGTGYSRVNEGWQSGVTAHNSSWAIKADHRNGFDNLIINDDGIGIAVQPNTDYVFWVYARVHINSGLGPIIQVNRDSAYGTSLNATQPLTSTNYGAFGKHKFRKVGFTFNSGSATKVWIRCFNNNGDVVVYYDDFHLAKLGGSLGFREAQWQEIDKALVAFRESGLLLKVPFMDNWGGQMGFLLNCADQIYGINGMEGGDTADSFDGNDWQFFTRTGAKTLYKQIWDFAAARNNSVDGLPWVKDWALWPELGNELRYKPPTDTGQNTINSTTLATMGKSGGWIDEMLQYVQPLFPNHVIEATDLGHSWQWFLNDPIYNGTLDYGVDFAVTGALPSVKSIAFHKYILEDASDYRLKAYSQKLLNNASAGRTRENLRLQLKDIIGTCKITLGKPVSWDECGFDKRATVVTGMVIYPRYKIVREVMKMFFQLGGDIFNLWHASTSDFDDSDYNFLIDGTLHSDTGHTINNLNNDDAKSMQVIQDITRALNGKKRQITPRQI